MRRIPVLREDNFLDYRHPAGGEAFKVLTPRREELFANKWCTMLFRGSSRDLFDVYKISELPMDEEVFRVCAVVDSLMREVPKLQDIDVNKVVGGISVDSALQNLLRRGVNSFSPAEARMRVIAFSRRQLLNLTNDQKKAINQFHDEKTFIPELIDKCGVLNPRIKNHPTILRVLQKLN